MKALRLYCIEHEKMVEALPMEFCEFGHEHYAEAHYGDAIVIEVDFCCFEKGYAACPPSLPYVEYAGAMPDADQLDEASLNALELQGDFQDEAS